MSFIDTLLDKALEAKERHEEREKNMTTDEKILREMKKANLLRALSGFNSNNDIYRR